MIARWVIPLGAVNPARVAPDHLHAVVCGWVDDRHHQSPKPWAVSPLRVVDGVATAEVSTLSAGARDRLMSNVTPGRPVRLGSQLTEVLAPPQLMDAMSDSSTPPGAWCVRFLTPTAFGSGARFSPWPDPRTVVRSCAIRYNAFVDGEPIDPASRLASSVWVSDIDGHSEVLSVERLTVSGFLGRIRYVCNDRAFSATFDTLMRFAEFAGLGRYTTRGLGTVRLENTWPA